MAKLETIAKEEKIAIEPAALELIAAVGEGSFRDAESLLEQVASFAGAAEGAHAKATITLVDAERITGRTGLRKVHAFAALMLAKDLKGALATLAAMNDEGHNLVQFTKDLIHYLRKTLSLAVNPALAASFEKDLTKDELAAMSALGNEKGADPATLVRLIKALIRAYAEMRYSPFAVVPLEVMLVEQLS